jgi:RNA polymerase sigma-70 factor (ECF subfamily)
MQDGEDVVQDTFVRAFRSVSKLRDEGSVWLWFKQIAHNLAIDFVKRSARRGISADPETIEKLDTRRDEMRHSMLPEIVQSIEALPETYRETAIYFYLEEWPYSQIAETLGIEPATVRQRISRINRLLRELLGRKTQ